MTDQQKQKRRFPLEAAKAWVKNILADIQNDQPEEPDDDNYPTCEDCGETSVDVVTCTEPVGSGFRQSPPDQADLCERCEDRRIHPADYYDGPDRRNEDGCDDD